MMFTEFAEIFEIFTNISRISLHREDDIIHNYNTQILHADFKLVSNSRMKSRGRVISKALYKSFRRRLFIGTYFNATQSPSGTRDDYPRPS